MKYPERSWTGSGSGKNVLIIIKMGEREREREREIAALRGSESVILYACREK